MRAVVGLGNPGEEYAGTPHNAGFAVVDEVTHRWSCRLRRSWRAKALVGKTAVGGSDVLVVKPETFMNLSGEAVSSVLRYWKLAPEDLIVVVDDADLPLGTIRIRAKGGSGGHRGLTSVIESLKSESFARVRIGIGRGEGEQSLKEYVLSALARAERSLFEDEVKRAADAVECILELGVDRAMNRFNASVQPEDREDNGREGR